MENIREKTHIISSSTFVLILLFCLLPFISVQCSGTKIVEATGVELLTASFDKSGYSDKKESQEESKESPNIFMILVFLSAIVGIVISIVLKNDKNKQKISVICSSAVIAVSLVLMNITMSYRVKSELSKDDEYNLSGMISINYEIGYWLCLLSSIALIIFIIFVNFNKGTKEIIDMEKAE